MFTLTSALRTAIASGLLLAGSSGTALAAPNVITFDTPGEYPIVIPAGVTSLQVVAVGGRGGEGTYSVPGGFGARVTANLPVTGGMTRWLLVGGNGVSGVGRAGAGGGGGASDVRTAPSSAGLTPTDPRVLVAAGGGGSGFGRLHGVDGSAGYGGDAGAPGGNSRLSVYPGQITSGGGAAAVPIGTGAGGTSGAVDGNGAAGGAGSLGRGGEGSFVDEHRGLTPGGFNGGGNGGGGAQFGPLGNTTYYAGGGGGGGLHGGGGGGGVMIFDGKSPRSAAGGAGGAGGSNRVPAGGSAVTDTVGQGSITISFEDATAPVVGLDAVPARTALPVAFRGTSGTGLGDGGVSVKVFAGATAGGTAVRTLGVSRDAATGSWQASLSGLAPGQYTARAEQADGAGNAGLSAARTFVVDTVAPVVSLTSPSDGTLTNSATPSFGGSAGTAPGDDATVEIEVRNAGGVVVQTVSAQRDGTTGAYAAAASSPLADGTYTAVATQSDDAGNLGSSAPATFTIDTTAPALTLTTPSPDGRTAPQPEFVGVGGTAPGDGATVTIRVHAGSSAAGPLVQTIAASRDPQSGAYRATSPFDLALGTYTVVAAQVDDLGNEAATAARTFTVEGSAGDRDGDRGEADRTKPVLTRVSLSPARFSVGKTKTAKKLKRGTSVRYTLSERATVTLAITRSGQRKPVGTLVRRGEQGANRIAFSGRLGSKALKPGRYVLILTAVDAAGNRSAAKRVGFRIW